MAVVIDGDGTFSINSVSYNLADNKSTQAIYEHANEITSAYTISSNNNGVSGGAITISGSGSVTVPAGSEWVIGTCVKSPCVAAGNNELVSAYR